MNNNKQKGAIIPLMDFQQRLSAKIWDKSHYILFIAVA